MNTPVNVHCLQHEYFCTFYMIIQSHIRTLQMGISLLFYDVL